MGNIVQLSVEFPALYLVLALRTLDYFLEQLTTCLSPGKKINVLVLNSLSIASPQPAAIKHRSAL